MSLSDYTPDDLLARQRTRRNRPALELTERHLEVLRLMADGRRDAEIATVLGVDTKTIMTHAQAIYSRLGARNRANAVSIGYRRGLLKVPAAPEPAVGQLLEI